MSFDSVEISVQDGAPIELYAFTVYGVTYYYTTAAEDQIIDGVTYLARVLSRSEIEDTNEIPRNNLTISCTHDFEMLRFYEAVPPSDVITLALYRKHRSDTELKAWWYGRVVNGVRMNERGQLYCENVYTSMRRSGLRRTYARLCPHVLYGAACRATDTTFRVMALLDSADGITLQSGILDGYADGRFAGGFVQWEAAPGQVEKRGIKEHVGDTITITHPITNLSALDTIEVYPGCQHTLLDCDTTFNNAVNYGGFPYMQRQNPMGQSSVF